MGEGQGLWGRLLAVHDLHIHDRQSGGTQMHPTTSWSQTDRQVLLETELLMCLDLS